MSSQLVRLFTCASILSLGGLTAASGIVACSSSDAAAPPADDDDDNADDDDDDDTAKSDAGSSSSSSSSGGMVRPADCKPEGTYDFVKATYSVSTAGAVCDSLAKGGNDNATPRTDVTFAKVDDETYQMTFKADPSYKLLLAIAKDRCQLAGAEQAYSLPGQDADGNKVTLAFDPNHIIDFDGDKVTDRVAVFVQSDPTGAKGTPCVVSTTAAGTKKP